jgi:uncharacterized protein
MVDDAAHELAPGAPDAGRALKPREVDPERTCIVTREVTAPDGLIRFVLSPDGTVTPDLLRRLPGRGVWVTATREMVAKAVGGKAFAKGFKRQVRVDPELPTLIRSLILRRIRDQLSIANKAGLVVSGATRVDSSLRSGDVQLLLHAIDGAEDGIQKLDRLFEAICRDLGRDPAIYRVLPTIEMSLALGRSNVIHAALRSGGLTTVLLDQLRRLVRYENGAPSGVEITPNIQIDAAKG